MLAYSKLGACVPFARKGLTKEGACLSRLGVAATGRRDSRGLKKRRLALAWSLFCVSASPFCAECRFRQSLLHLPPDRQDLGDGQSDERKAEQGVVDTSRGYPSPCDFPGEKHFTGGTTLSRETCRKEQG